MMKLGPLTSRSYDAAAGQYADSFRGELAGKPIDRALLTCLAGRAWRGGRECA